MPYLGRRLKELRVERALTQEALAAKLEISRGCVSHWEHGLQPVPEKYMAGLASILKVSEAYLRGSATDYSPLGFEVSKRVRRLAWRSPELPPYPIKGSLEQMLGLGWASHELHARAMELHRPEMVRAMDGTWSRDTAFELLGAFHLLAAGARLGVGTLSQMGCPLLAIDHAQSWRNAGAALREGLVLERSRTLLIVFPQVWLVLPRSHRCCRVDLLAFYAQGGRFIWADVEFDGAHHPDYYQADAERAAALGLPRLGYANSRTRQLGLADLILQDAALALERDAAGRRQDRRTA